jgi:Rrf2 family protein
MGTGCRKDPEREIVPRLVLAEQLAERLLNLVRAVDRLDVHRVDATDRRPHGRYGSWMRVSAKVDYALRAMLELAAAGGLVKGEQIATAQGIPQKFLETILIDLRHAELVSSRRGVEGGYALGKPADEISIADVIRAVEGPIATVRGVRPDDVEYDGPARALAPVWIELRAAMRGVLEETTLADVVERSRAVNR